MQGPLHATDGGGGSMGSVGNEGAKGRGQEGMRCCQVISSVLADALPVLYEYKSTNTDASAPART